jgi:hypothetical protein
MVCYALRGVGGVQHCLLGGWVVYLCVVDVELSSIVMVCQSVRAHTWLGWVDLCTVVRTGLWDHGEKIHLCCKFLVLRGFQYVYYVCQQPNKNKGFTHLEIERNPWLGGYHPEIPRSLCPLSSTEFVEPSPNKVRGYATGVQKLLQHQTSPLTAVRPLLT